MAHSHHNHNQSSKNLKVAFFLNFGFSVLELIGGLYSNSYAIISDSFHDFVDSLVILLAFILNKLSQKEDSDLYPYGKLKLKLIGSIATSTILVVGSSLVVIGAVGRLFDPVEVKSDVMIILAILGVGVNFIAMFRMKHTNSRLDKAILLHMLEDALGWVVVLVSAIIINYTQLYIIDPLLSIGISSFIIWGALKNLLSCYKSVVFKNPLINQMDEIKNICSAYITDISNTQFKILELDDNCYILSINTDQKYVNLQALESQLSSFGINEIYYRKRDNS